MGRYQALLLRSKKRPCQALALYDLTAILTGSSFASLSAARVIGHVVILCAVRTNRVARTASLAAFFHSGIVDGPSFEIDRDSRGQKLITGRGLAADCFDIGLVTCCRLCLDG